MFPPFPRDIPISSTCFSFNVTCPIHTPNLAKRGMSTKLAVMSNMLMRHAHVLATHDVSRSTSSLSSSSSSSHVQTGHPASFILGLFRNSDITRIHITQHKQQPTHHVFYITCSNTDTCQQLRNTIHQHTTLTTNDTKVSYMNGKVSSIPHNMSLSEVMSNILLHAPEVTSLVLTPILHPAPLTHPRSTWYFYIRRDQIQFLRNLPPLPGQQKPLIWFKYVKPAIIACSLCYTVGHTRSKCPHLNSSASRFCANCGEQSHTAKHCEQNIQCRCCGKHEHNILECERYRPSYKKLDLVPSLSSLSNYPSLPSSRTSGSGSTPSSTYSSVASRSALRDPNSDSPPHKRTRHTSFDNESISSYNSRDNHSPNSDIMQEYLDSSSLTRSPDRLSSLAAHTHACSFSIPYIFSILISRLLLNLYIL